jgi:hypothetical protein
MTQEEQAAILQGRAAQYQPTREERIHQFKDELFDTPTGNEIRDGLEIRDDSPQPAADTAEVDPGWIAFEQRAQAEQDSESAAWEVAAGAEERSALSNAMRALETYSDEAEIVGAALHLATVSPPGFAAFLDHIEAEYEDPELRQQIGQSVVGVLGTISQHKGETEFQQSMAESERLNVEDAQAALQAVAEYRDMSPADVEKVARAYMEATGRPLRSSMLSVMPGADRAEFLNELAIAHEASERGARLQRFAASFFGPEAGSTSVSEGLVTKNGVPRDLPPVMWNSAYAVARAEKSIRAEDEPVPHKPVPSATPRTTSSTSCCSETTTSAIGATDSPTTVADQRPTVRSRRVIPTASRTSKPASASVTR